ncbi:hypothetical protein P3X46_027494 [Hevea brasiliensis]|uniref:Uncharacterized protein n=1 Tax=Hevea brasiliensis TaxID=3981 RepID=A0ABQ9L125_HEVBR|nr:hypothetical protein P3X46_027494 [Hevea brasiliensis]
MFLQNLELRFFLYKKKGHLGAHANTVSFHGVDLDLGFMAFNPATYPNVEFFASLGVEMEVSEMSFSVSLDEGDSYEWVSRNSFSSLFAQKKNVINPYFWKLVREINKFKDDVFSYLELFESNPDIDRPESLGNFINSRGYSELFRKAYLFPICGSIWSSPQEEIMNFSAFSALSFCLNNHLLQIFSSPQCLTVRRQSHPCVNKVRQLLESCGCQIRTGSKVCMLSTNPSAWCPWNFLGRTDTKGCLTYWLNVLQNIGETSLPFLVTLNPDRAPDHILLKWSTSHPVM